MSKETENKTKESGNVVAIVLVALVVVAVGTLAYMSGSNTEAKQEDAPIQIAQKQKEVALPEIKPGNPVVGKVGDVEIKRLDVLNFIQTLPPQTRQTPITQLFPFALEQIINSYVVEKQSAGVNLDSDERVQEQLAAAKEQIVRNVFVQREVEKKVTEERLKDAYDAYVSGFPDVTEARAFHILIKDGDEAKTILADVQGGADFQQMAAEKSIDTTSKNGGDLGYFLKRDVVEEFGEAVFKADIGTIINTPVKSQFGYHIIKVEDRRKRTPVEFKEAKPILESQLRRAALDEVMREWHQSLGVERFDVNGEALKQAAAAPANTAVELEGSAQ